MVLKYLENVYRKAMEITFRKLQETDWEQVANIYKEGIATGIATF